MSTDLFEQVAYLSATRLGELLAAGEVGSVELVEAYLARLDAYDGALRSHVFVDGQGARLAALAAERESRAGQRRGPLHGVPVSHKDNLWTAGVRTGVHTRTSFAHVPARDATAVERLRNAGMVLLGKTNTTEFACGDQLVHGDTPNPWSAHAYSGASSAGSASAVAAGLTGAATGSDTGGSIRAPAAMCGIVGVKPTYGRVSRHGLVPLAWSMDHVGPMARSVQDAAHMLAAMAGSDKRDPTSDPRPVPADLALLGERLDGIVIGVPRGHFATGLAPAVAVAFDSSLTVLEQLGATITEVALPCAGNLGPVGSLLSMWEAFTLHASHLREEAQAYGPKARASISSGGFYGSDEVGQALQLRTLWAREVAAAFAQVDVIVTPTLPEPVVTRDDWVARPPDTSWATRAFSLTGHPALTLPCGFDGDGMPIGLQVAARHFEERTMFQVAHCYERATPWHDRRPDPSWWSGPIPSTAAGATVPELSSEERRGWAAQAERLGLRLRDADLDRVGGIVKRVRAGLETLRLDRTSDVEPLWYMPSDRRGGVQGSGLRLGAGGGKEW